jgi:hypothetical protein
MAWLPMPGKIRAELHVSQAERRPLVAWLTLKSVCSDAVAAHYRQQIKAMQDAHAGEVARLRQDRDHARLQLEKLRAEHAGVRGQLAQLEEAYYASGRRPPDAGTSWVEMAVGMLSGWQRWFWQASPVMREIAPAPSSSIGPADASLGDVYNIV